MLGFTDIESVSGLILLMESLGTVPLGVSSLPSNTGVIKFQTDVIQMAGFLTNCRISNLPGFALDSAGAQRKRNPNRAMKAAVLMSFLCIGASFKILGAPCGMMGEKKKFDWTFCPSFSSKAAINLRDYFLKVKCFLREST